MIYSVQFDKEITLVAQAKDSNDCVLACVAMLTGKSIEELREQLPEETDHERGYSTFEEEFLSVLESYFEDENLELLEEYTGQPDLVHFMLVEISTPDEDGTTLEDETGVQLFISMMALISVISKTNS
jgi:hypothetical protein